MAIDLVAFGDQAQTNSLRYKHRAAAHLVKWWRKLLVCAWQRS